MLVPVLSRYPAATPSPSEDFSVIHARRLLLVAVVAFAAGCAGTTATPATPTKPGSKMDKTDSAMDAKMAEGRMPGETKPTGKP